MKPKILDAVHALDPNAVGYSISGGVLDLGENVNNITESQIDTKLAELISDWDSQEYARNRATAYDSIGNQLDMQYHDLLNGTTTWKDAVAKVKADNPKD
tara:strand:+ start:507 stop:806 length:300 start_codon:yes stop_codon:yes gene_type:complete